MWISWSDHTPPAASLTTSFSFCSTMFDNQAFRQALSGLWAGFELCLSESRYRCGMIEHYRLLCHTILSCLHHRGPRRSILDISNDRKLTCSWGLYNLADLVHLWDILLHVWLPLSTGTFFLTYASSGFLLAFLVSLLAEVFWSDLIACCTLVDDRVSNAFL